MSDKKISIDRCGVEQYAEMLRELDSAFENGENWFVRHLGHACPPVGEATEEDTQKHIISLCDGKIVGVVGAYPMEWIVGDGESSVRLQTVGVGQVSCLPEYRGLGVMSGMLRYALDDMRANGVHISWLMGERFRYKNYGWDQGGNQAEFSFSRHRMDMLCHGGNDEIVVAAADDWEEINRIYESLPTYITRDEKLWKRHIRRENCRYLLCRSEKKSAYIAYTQDDPAFIMEAAGDPSCVERLLYHQLQSNEMDRLTVSYPCCEDALAMALYAKTTYAQVTSVCSVNVVDAESLFSKLAPFVVKQGRQAGVDVNVEGLSTEMKERICRRLMGYVYSPSVEGFAFLKPLVFWLPLSDNV